MKKFDDKLYLVDMYNDDYFPRNLVDKIKNLMVHLVDYLENANHSIDEVQEKLDIMIEEINIISEEFWENGSEIETVARESIGETVEHILSHFNIVIDIETAIRNRDW